VSDRVTLGPGPASVLDADGSALVIHAKADDMRSDPAGESGDRVACGEITRRR
jgi:superoxide dismutase, Cu-Zn family